MQEAVHDSSTPAPVARRVLTVVRTVVAWALLAGGLWLVWPSSLGGCTTLTVVSGHSMEPTYYTGDLVIARCGRPHVGQVVVYRPPEIGGSARIIHRIVGGDGVTGWRMKGDNNSFADPFSPRDADVLGVAVLHLPKVGRISVLVFNPWLWGAVILAAAVLLIWPSSEDDAEANDADANDAEVTGPDANGADATGPEAPGADDAGSTAARTMPAGAAGSAEGSLVAADR